MTNTLLKQATARAGLVGLLVIFVLPFAVVTYQLIAELSEKINFADREKKGVEYNLPLRKFLEHLIEHRRLANAYLSGDASFKEKLVFQQAEIENDIKAIDERDRFLGSILKTTDLWLTLEEKWQELKGKVLFLSPKESFDEHTALINDIIAAIAHVGDTSNLILDPELDSYYLMDATIVKLPLTIERTAQIREMGENIAKKKAIAPEEKSELIVLSGAIEDPMQKIRRGMRVAFSTNPNLKTKLKADARETFSASHIFIALVNRKLINSETIDIQPDNYVAAGTSAIDAQFRFYDALSPALDELLRSRLDEFYRKKHLVQGFAILVLATVIYVFAALERNLAKRQQAEQAMRQAEEKYRSIFENANEGIFQTTPDGRYISANPALARIYGYNSPEELIANISNILRQLYVDPTRRVEFIRLMQERDAISDFESEVYRADGSKIWISENARSIKNNNGTLLYYEGSVRDITERKLAEQALSFEREQSERLLLNILPAPIAQRLKKEQGSIADYYEEVTVLFADIVGFTQLSSRISPTELVDLLNQIFSSFDCIAEQHGLEKIKTIGDAYMVVGGIPTPRTDCAEAVAEMAIDMLEYISKFNSLTGENFNIRIGINTGPVVAGVIGIKKFIYDLWGDTVNIASRMESHGEAGAIQVTAATYERLRDKYLFEERGVIQVKGKGEMMTYMLAGKREN